MVLLLATAVAGTSQGDDQHREPIPSNLDRVPIPSENLTNDKNQTSPTISAPTPMETTTTAPPITVLSTNYSNNDTSMRANDTYPTLPPIFTYPMVNDQPRNQSISLNNNNNATPGEGQGQGPFTFRAPPPPPKGGDTCYCNCPPPKPHPSIPEYLLNNRVLVYDPLKDKLTIKASTVIFEGSIIVNSYAGLKSSLFVGGTPTNGEASTEIGPGRIYLYQRQEDGPPHISAFKTTPAAGYTLDALVVDGDLYEDANGQGDVRRVATVPPPRFSPSASDSAA